MDAQQHSENHATTVGSLAFDPRMDQLAARFTAQTDDRKPKRKVLDLADLEQQEINEVARINEQLRKAIEKGEESYYALAKRSGVNAVVISRFACGERDLRLDTAAKLADALGLSLVKR